MPRTLSSMKQGLAVVDTDGCEPSVIKAVKRGLLVYGYLNAGALERERSYYKKFKHLRIANYEGWDGEYWVDVTDMQWQLHLIEEAKKIKATGAIGLYLDNTDIYYMVKHGFKNPMRAVPSPMSVYAALTNVILKIHKLGLVVMPNGGDVFLRKFMSAHPNVITTINQEGVFYEDFKKQSKEETAYRKEWCKWAQERISGKVRIIEYCRKPEERAKVAAYCIAHGWHYYISKHTELRGD